MGSRTADLVGSGGRRYTLWLRSARRVRAIGHGQESAQWPSVRIPVPVRQSVKILVWDRDDYVLWYKRLEAGVFNLPRLMPGTRSVELRASELWMLLDGIDLSKLKRSPRYQHQSGAA